MPEPTATATDMPEPTGTPEPTAMPTDRPEPIATDTAALAATATNTPEPTEVLPGQLPATGGPLDELPLTTLLALLGVLLLLGSAALVDRRRLLAGG